MYYAVLDQHGEVIQILQPDVNICYDGRCGGCDWCMMQQASYSGVTVVELTPEMERQMDVRWGRNHPELVHNWKEEGF